MIASRGDVVTERSRAPTRVVDDEGTGGDGAQRPRTPTVSPHVAPESTVTSGTERERRLGTRRIEPPDQGTPFGWPRYNRGPKTPREENVGSLEMGDNQVSQGCAGQGVGQGVREVHPPDRGRREAEAIWTQTPHCARCTKRPEVSRFPSTPSKRPSSGAPVSLRACATRPSTTRVMRRAEWPSLSKP